MIGAGRTDAITAHGFNSSMHVAMCIHRAPVTGAPQLPHDHRISRVSRVSRIHVHRVVTCMAGRKAANSSRGPQVSSGNGQPAWKRYAKKDKALGKRAEATLEMIWSKTAWLTDEHIQGMWDEHRVRKDVVVAWFAEKRRESRRQKKTSEGADGGPVADGSDGSDVSEEQQAEE